ncbi:hypothetical protein BGZ57DRAFT_565503 [Hyaloscypha finlandica]|nr:hypothetical protein BGZ57DRAFT_565503 [Hyaloscypha finlandica]
MSLFRAMSDEERDICCVEDVQLLPFRSSPQILIAGLIFLLLVGFRLSPFDSEQTTFPKPESNLHQTIRRTIASTCLPTKDRPTRRRTKTRPFKANRRVSTTSLHSLQDVIGSAQKALVGALLTKKKIDKKRVEDKKDAKFVEELECLGISGDENKGDN